MVVCHGMSFTVLPCFPHMVRPSKLKTFASCAITPSGSSADGAARISS